MIINNKQFYPIPGHSNYLISVDGEVYGLQKKKLLKGGFNNMGYGQVWFGNKWYRRHYLVAISFIPNPNGYKEINHQDGNKLNNHVDNLDWCSRSYNQVHAVANGLLKLNKNKFTNKGNKHSEETKKAMSIKKLGKNHPKYKGSFITPAGTFHSANQAGLANNISGKTVKKRCLNNMWLYAGWNFTNEKPPIQYNEQTHNAPQSIPETKSMSVKDYTQPKHKTTLKEIVLCNGRVMKIK